MSGWASIWDAKSVAPPFRRQPLARPVTAPRAGVHLAGALPPDQRLIDVRHADPKKPRRRARRHAAVNRRQDPPPQILRITLPLPPSHRHPPHLAVGAANHTFLVWGIAFSDSSQCGYAPVCVGRSVILLTPTRSLSRPRCGPSATTAISPTYSPCRMRLPRRSRLPSPRPLPVLSSNGRCANPESLRCLGGLSAREVIEWAALVAGPDHPPGGSWKVGLGSTPAAR